ncbi:hypothetical protein [Ralstonia sp.]|uniref:hypothetical protein n=1 Tax=Ralstonia sp. TaxID=54061 RepID=UPI0012E03054|nr:hypothetical protein [Ralstonia sp.]HWV04017.1 hypothetical protein [Ralstonia sp.]
MELPLDICFQDVPYTKTTEEDVVVQGGRLSHACSQISRCRVSLIRNQRVSLEGTPYSVELDVMTRRHQHVFSKMSGNDVRTALRDAFTEVIQELESVLAFAEPAPLLANAR